MNRLQAMEKSMGKLSDEAIADFREVVANAEALLKATTNQSGEKMAEIRAKAEESIRVAKTRMRETEEALLLKTKAAAKVTDTYVHESPWQAIGIVAAFSLVVGLLISRR